MEKSSRGFVPMLLLCIFWGCLGAHNFYAGNTRTGIIQLLTLGGIGFWALYDFVMILTEKFTDAEGRVVRK